MGGAGSWNMMILRVPSNWQFSVNSIEFTKDIAVTSVFMLASSVGRYITLTGFWVRK